MPRSRRPLALKRPKNLRHRERLRLRQLVAINLRFVHAYTLKEMFQHLWSATYLSPHGLTQRFC
jgi:hypothetical protein